MAEQVAVLFHNGKAVFVDVRQNVHLRCLDVFQFSFENILLGCGFLVLLVQTCLHAFDGINEGSGNVAILFRDGGQAFIEFRVFEFGRGVCVNLTKLFQNSIGTPLRSAHPACFALVALHKLVTRFVAVIVRRVGIAVSIQIVSNIISREVIPVFRVFVAVI